MIFITFLLIVCDDVSILEYALICYGKKMKCASMRYGFLMLRKTEKSCSAFMKHLNTPKLVE
jgi:hypothetical protein